MSSDILSRPVDVSKFDLIYAGAQKNLGPAGVVIVIAKKSFLATANEDLPTMLKYSTYAENDSLYNTAPVFAIYMVNKTLHWIKKQGGVKVLQQRNQEKAKIIYDAIDNSNGFYIGHAEKPYRSMMNITFNLADKDLEKEFVAEGKKQGFVGIGGHRLVGGCRASTYNAVTKEACEALAKYMKEFQKLHSWDKKMLLQRKSIFYWQCFINNYNSWKLNERSEGEAPCARVRELPVGARQSWCKRVPLWSGRRWVGRGSPDIAMNEVGSSEQIGWQRGDFRPKWLGRIFYVNEHFY